MQMFLNLAYPAQADHYRIESLSDLLVTLEYKMFPELVARQKAALRHISAMRTVCRRLTQMFRRSLDQILISEIVGIDTKLIEYIEGCGSSHEVAVQYACDTNKLLQHARELGWSCDSLALRDSWEPVLAALKAPSCGSTGIVDFAIRDGKHPSKFSEHDVAVWRQNMLSRGRALNTIENAERTFRRRISTASLQPLLSSLNQHTRQPSEYALRLDEMPATMRGEIGEIQKWKLTEYLPGRNANLAVRPPTGRNIVKTLRQLCGFAINIQRRQGISSLRDVMTQEIVCNFIDWLYMVRNCKRASIVARLSGVHALTEHYPLFAGSDFNWFLPKLNSLPMEHTSELEKRKNQKFVPYLLLSQVPRKICQDRTRNSGTSPLETAWQVHDELFISWFLHLPWRQRNVRECGTKAPSAINVFLAEIPPDLRYRLDLEPWAREQLKANPRQQFWQFSFLESQTKAKHRVRDLIPRELVPLLVEYLDRHRPLLVGRVDRGTLFLNRAGNPMSAKDVSRLVTRLTIHHIGHYVTPHIIRDIYAAHFLSTGGSILRLQQKLWHRDIATTWSYCKRFNASNGANAIDNWQAA